MPRSSCVSCAVTVFVSAYLGVATVTAQSVGAPPGNGADVLAVIPFDNISGAEPWWPVLTCPRVAGFEVFTEGV